MGAFSHRRPGSVVQDSNNHKFYYKGTNHPKMRQFIGLWTIGVVVAVLISFLLDSSIVEASPTRNQNGMRINRRGFKSSLLSTARGFGKRSDPSLDLEPDSMQAPFETIPYNPRVLAYLMKAEEAASDESRGWHHRAEDY